MYKKNLLAISLFIALIGFTVIIGWIFDITVLKSILPQYISMKFNTAISLIVSAAIFYLFIIKQLQTLVPWLSLFLIVLGAASMIQDIFKLNLGIDELVFIDFEMHQNKEATPGRMAFTTSLSFFLLGVAYLFIRSNSAQKIGQYILHIISLLSFIAIIGYLFNVPTFYKLSFLTAMAVHTAVAFLVLSIGVSLLNPSFGVTALFMQKTVGSKIARRIFPRMLLAIVILGFLRIESHRFDLVDVAFGIALFATSFVVIGLFIIWDTVNALNKADYERTKAEDEIKNLNENLERIVSIRNQELRAIFDSAQVSMIGMDLVGNITHFNKGGEILLGYSVKEIIGKTPAMIHLNEEIVKRGEELTAALGRPIVGFDAFIEFAKQGKHESREWTYVRKDGKHIPVLLDVTPIIDDNNTARGYLAIGTNIAELKKASKDLEHLANQLQRNNTKLLNFAHITSHNLRAPVNNLNSLLYFYKESTDEEARVLLIAKFETVIHHLTTTLNELIESLKIQIDININRDQISFNDAFIKTKDILAGQIIESGAVVEADFSKIEIIEYPITYLESIFLNLCSNALKYRAIDRAPKIDFKTDYVDGKITLTVSDNGLGIDLEKHGDQIFGFKKTFHSHKEAKGVGLFITKTQVETMGGHISVTSDVNKGTKFMIFFNK